MAQPSLTQTVLNNRLGKITGSTAGIPCKIGACSLGTPGTVYRFTGQNIGAVRTQLGYGPLAEAVASTLALTGKTVLAVPTTNTVPGAAGSVTHVGTGTSVMTVSGTPYDDLSIIVKPASATKITFSLDGGVTYSPAVLLSALAYAIAGTGLTVTFGAGTIVAADTYSFSTTAPVGNLTDVQAAIDVAVNYSVKPGFLHIVGPQPYVAVVVGVTGVAAYKTLSTVLFTAVAAGVAGNSKTVVLVAATGASQSTTAGISGSAITITLGTDEYEVVNATVANVISAIAAAGTVAAIIGAAPAAGQTTSSAVLSASVQNLAGGVDAVSANPGSLASTFTTVDAKVASAFSSRSKPMFAIIELPDQIDNVLIAGTASLASATGRVMMTGGYFSHSSAMPVMGGSVFRRHAGLVIADRIAMMPIKEDTGRVASGSLERVVALERDETLTPGLGAARIECLRTIDGLDGFFINSDTDGNMASQAGSDFVFVQYRRVMDRACELARVRGLQLLNDDWLVDSTTGFLLDTEASEIENQLTAYLESGLGSDVSDIKVTVDREEAVISTDNLTMYIEVTPLSYSKTITQVLSLRNPAVE